MLVVNDGKLPQVQVVLPVSNVYTIPVSAIDEAQILSPSAAFTITTASNPANGQRLIIKIVTGATAYTITWNTIFTGVTGLSLPTTLSVSTTTNLLFKYDSTLSKYVLLAIDTPSTNSVPLIKSTMRTVTTAPTITDADGYIRVNSASALSFALNTTGLTAPTAVILKNIGAGTMTLTNTIEGTANRPIAQYASMTLVWTGSVWEIN
jgi:hypothetical protein